jgi:hypothetical protein
LKGKLRSLPGGNSGIALATAKRFVAEGAFVFTTARRQAVYKNITAIRADISKPDDIDQLYKHVAAKKGKIDILFSDAGVVETKQTAHATPEHFDKRSSRQPDVSNRVCARGQTFIGNSLILRGLPLEDTVGHFAARRLQLSSRCA